MGQLGIVAELPALSEFTDEQRAVIEATADERLLVVAGAGTGKTATLIQRLAHLSSEENLSPASEILVLTFSRAAAGELRRRLREAGGAAAYVKVSTFDSFATRMLARHEPGGVWADHSYDDRIRDATALIEQDSEAADDLATIRHLVVDEVQDLVGVRARFVLSLVTSVAGGYTLCGDPAQSIYDFQLHDEQDSADASLDSREFLKRLAENEDTGPRTVTFSKNFRSLSAESRAAFHLGGQLGAADTDHDAVRDQLLDIVGGLDAVQAASLPTILSRVATSTIVLTRYNGQALALSRELGIEGVPHRLQRSSTERVTAPWIGVILHDYRPNRITRERLEKLLEERPHASAPEPDEAWRMLSRMVGSLDRALDIRLLNRAASRGSIPDQLTWVPDALVVISTVHRAKGLEFDQVLVADPEDWQDEDDVGEETRVLYVALTRSRRSLKILSPPARRQLLKSRGHPRDRWVWHGHKKWMRLGLEVMGDDVEWREPAWGDWFGAAVDLQHYLAHEVRPGDAVVLRRIEQQTTEGPRTFYVVFHGSRPIGITTPDFGSDLFTVLRQASASRRIRFPAQLLDLTVDCLETCFGSPAASARAGLEPHGIWLRPRVTGLAKFDWDEES